MIVKIHSVCEWSLNIREIIQVWYEKNGKKNQKKDAKSMKHLLIP